MADGVSAGARILGSLRSADGMGVVRMEDRVLATIDSVWSALTDPSRLSRWLGDIEGDLRLGGEFHARFLASGWQGMGRVEACEPSRRILVLTTDAAEPSEESAKPGEGSIEVTLAADGDQTVVVWEERGMPLEYIAAYGAGIQIHVEDLAAFLSGRDRCDPRV